MRAADARAAAAEARAAQGEESAAEAWAAADAAEQDTADARADAETAETRARELGGQLQAALARAGQADTALAEARAGHQAAVAAAARAEAGLAAARELAAAATARAERAETDRQAEQAERRALTSRLVAPPAPNPRPRGPPAPARRKLMSHAESAFTVPGSVNVNADAAAYQKLRGHLAYLKLGAAIDALPGVLDAARDGQLSVLAALEADGRRAAATEARKLATRLHFAALPAPWTLEDYDYSAQPGADPALIGELATLRFIGEAGNVIFIGAPGVGKTMLAAGLARAAAEAGRKVHFTTCENMTRPRRPPPLSTGSPPSCGSTPSPPCW